MATAFEVRRVVDKPIDEVWSALTDWSNAHRWMNGVESIDADGPTEVGTTLSFVARGRDRSSQIVAVDPGISVTLRSDQGSVSADYVYTLVPDGPSTGMVLKATCEARGVWKLMSPMIRWAMKRSDSGQLDALAAVLA